MIQKIVNVIAVSSGVVSLAVISSGLYVYVNRDAIIDGFIFRAMVAVLSGAGGLGGLLVPSLPPGPNDLLPSAPQSNPMAGENAAAGGSTIIPTF